MPNCKASETSRGRSPETTSLNRLLSSEATFPIPCANHFFSPTLLKYQLEGLFPIFAVLWCARSLNSRNGHEIIFGPWVISEQARPRYYFSVLILLYGVLRSFEHHSRCVPVCQSLKSCYLWGGTPQLSHSCRTMSVESRKWKWILFSTLASLG